VAPMADVTTNPLSGLGFLGPDTEMARAIATFDWGSTPLGPISQWRDDLRASVSIMLGSDFPAALWWGPDLVLICNAQYETQLLRERGRHLGAPFGAIWAEVADIIMPQFEEVRTTGRGLSWIDQRIDMLRDGAMAETYWNYSFTPVIGSDGVVAGLFNGARETTTRVFQERHDALLLALDAELLAADSVDAMIDRALATIGTHLGAKRTGFGEIDGAARALDIRRCWTDGTSMTDISGRYPLGTFGNISGELAAGRQILIEDNLTDPRTADPDTRAAYARAGLRSGVVVPIIDRGRYAAGIFAQDDVPRRWTPHQAQLTQAAADRLWQALDRSRTEIALRESEQRYRLIFEQADDIIFTADVDQTLTDCNAAAARAMGISREELIGRSIAEFVSPDDFARTTAQLHHKLVYGGSTTHEVVVTGCNGDPMRWENNSTLIIDRDGKPSGLLSISRDVTQRRAFEERRELLIHELNHRVKNTLALVQAIAHQSFRPEAAVAVVQRDFTARLRTLAAAHDLLTREQWEGVTLAEVVAAATAALSHDRIAIAGPPLTVRPKAAVAIAMTLHELGTNALKYGGLSVPMGSVSVDWCITADRAVLRWQESGGPPVVAPDRRGFGVKMIERALASDLAARVTINFASTGVVCIIDAPLEGNVT